MKLEGDDRQTNTVQFPRITFDTTGCCDHIPSFVFNVSEEKFVNRERIDSDEIECDFGSFVRSRQFAFLDQFDDEFDPENPKPVCSNETYDSKQTYEYLVVNSTETNQCDNR